MKFKVGNEVRILPNAQFAFDLIGESRNFITPGDYSTTGGPDMRACLGRSGKIVRDSTASLLTWTAYYVVVPGVYGGSWWWPELALEKVPSKKRRIYKSVTKNL